jgi:transcriptional regulator with XRE-family HTH domain
MGGITGKRLRQAQKRAGISSQVKFGLLAGFTETGLSARMSQNFTGKHQPDLQIIKLLAAVVKTPVPYFYCEDDQLADLILKFGTLDEGQKKRVLAFANEL